MYRIVDKQCDKNQYDQRNIFVQNSKNKDRYRSLMVLYTFDRTKVTLII